MNPYPILNLCARTTGHPEQQLLLQKLCQNFTDWQNLLRCAEMEGMTPLLNKHIIESESRCPVSIRRSLAVVNRQHRHRSQVLTRTLLNLLELFDKEQLTPLIIKGAALCHTVYPDPALRPMRDIDILMREDEVNTGQAALEATGFQVSKAPIPPNHFHLPPLLKTVDGCHVCVEIHRGLYPDCPPFHAPIHFEEMLLSARKFSVHGHAALTMGNEDMLWYLYQHGFCTPLTYESYRLINSADIISLTELNYSSFDWSKLRHDSPQLSNALPMMHHLSPWDPSAVDSTFVPSNEKKKNRSTDPFRGWPKVKFRDQKTADTGTIHLLYHTFIPPRWWLMVYYGISSWTEIIWSLFVRHPRHIFWWISLHYSYLEPAMDSNDKNKKNLLTRIGNRWEQLLSLLAKLL